MHELFPSTQAEEYELSRSVSGWRDQSLDQWVTEWLSCFSGWVSGPVPG